MIKRSVHIDDHAEMLSLWEARTRYVLDYHLEDRKIKAAIEGISDYLNHVEKKYFVESEYV